jgi:hypothetical protein
MYRNELVLFLRKDGPGGAMEPGNKEPARPSFLFNREKSALPGIGERS